MFLNIKQNLFFITSQIKKITPLYNLVLIFGVVSIAVGLVLGLLSHQQPGQNKGNISSASGNNSVLNQPIDIPGSKKPNSSDSKGTTQGNKAGASNQSNTGSASASEFSEPNASISDSNQGTPLDSTCLLVNTSGCDNEGGKTITFNNVTTQQGNTGFVFQCTGPLSNYSDVRAAISGSGWPVHLNLNYSAGSYNYSLGQPISSGVIADISGVSLANGCTGDGDANTIDLIIHIQGDGRTFGLEKDAFKINGSIGPSNIQLTTGGGSINCGPREGANSLKATHQDAIQIQNGNNIGFYGITVGDWVGQKATCWGAGGALFISSASGHSGTNITINHMKAIACNHGLNGDASGASTSGSVLNSVFRTGRASDLTDRLATIDSDTGANTIGLCSNVSAPVSANTLGLSTWSFTNLVGDMWSQSGQAWSPGFNPAFNGGL